MMGIRIPDHCRALIIERLTADPDVATTSLRVSLICPLGQMRLTVPCRAVTCSHLQCFDAALYLQMNEKKPTWICPVCGENAPYKRLFIDGLFMDILKEYSDVDEIEFQEDGRWRPMRPKKEEIKVSSQSSSDDSSSSDEDPDPHATAKPGEAGQSSSDDSSSLDEDRDPHATAKPGEDGQSSSDDSSSLDEEPDPPATAKPGKKVDVIDLTSSSETASSSSDTASSEAEPDPPAKKRCLDISKTKEIHSKGVPNSQASDLPSSLSDQSSLATIPADMQRVEVENGEEGKNQKKRLHKKEVRCEVCYVNLGSSVQVAVHNSGKTHRKNLLRLEQGMERLPPRTQVEDGEAAVVRHQDRKCLHCKACDVELTFDQEVNHIRGQKHRKNLLRLRANQASATASEPPVQQAMAMPKLSSGPDAIQIRITCVDEACWSRKGSFDIFEKDNKINLCIKLNCGGPIKTFQLNQNVKHIAMNLNRITLTLKDGAFINLDQMSAALTQKTKEYLEKVKQGKQDSRVLKLCSLCQYLPQDHLTSWVWETSRTTS